MKQGLGSGIMEFDASTHSERERRQGMITRECLTEILGAIRTNGVAFELERLQRVVESKAVRHMLHVSSNVVQLFQAHDQYAMCVCVQCAMCNVQSSTRTFKTSVSSEWFCSNIAPSALPHCAGMTLCCDTISRDLDQAQSIECAIDRAVRWFARHTDRINSRSRVLTHSASAISTNPPPNALSSRFSAVSERFCWRAWLMMPALASNNPFLCELYVRVSESERGQEQWRAVAEGRTARLRVARCGRLGITAISSSRLSRFKAQLYAIQYMVWLVG